MRSATVLLLIWIAATCTGGCGKPASEPTAPVNGAEVPVDGAEAPAEAAVTPEPPTPATATSRTRVVMLGTGTPIHDPLRSGPSVAVVVDQTSYIVDFGPGVVRRASAAEQLGFEALAVENLTRAFCTHLHSDHTAGYPDLILTPWVLGRKNPLHVYGPPGLQSMTDHVLAAWQEDIDVRNTGNQPAEDHGDEVVVHEISPGVVYRDDLVTVTAFDVQHGAWEHAYGYRFETPDRVVVISGDTVAVDEIATQCSGCDVLVHEVYAKAGFDLREPDWQAYHVASHTSGYELGELAVKARPDLLVLTHQLLWGATEEQLLSEIRRSFEGEVVYANDLDVF